MAPVSCQRQPHAATMYPGFFPSSRAFFSAMRVHYPLGERRAAHDNVIHSGRPCPVTEGIDASLACDIDHLFGGASVRTSSVTPAVMGRHCSRENFTPPPDRIDQQPVNLCSLVRQEPDAYSERILDDMQQMQRRAERLPRVSTYSVYQ